MEDRLLAFSLVALVFSARVLCDKHITCFEKIVTNTVRFHIKCRNGIYINNVPRTVVPGYKMAWSVPWYDYTPQFYQEESIKDENQEDPYILDQNSPPKWNTLDKGVNRMSLFGEYQILDGLPINPVGRTGIFGRGLLDRWGPNHEVNIVVTRWKLYNNKRIYKNAVSNLNILQVTVVKWKGKKKWALPGSKIKPKQSCANVFRNAYEELIDFRDLEMMGFNTDKINDGIEKLFKKGKEIYRGYVDDPRNTDNAWVETVVNHYHDDAGTYVAKIFLTHNETVKWVDATSNQCWRLYGNHADFVQTAVKMMRCHW